MKILGIDYGDRYVGFAECDDSEILAYPLKTVKIKSMKEAVSATQLLVNANGIKHIVIGLPLLADGSEGERASKTRAFGRVISRVTGLAADYYDERLSTITAESYLEDAGIKKCNYKNYVDQMSAQIILNDYMTARKKR